MLKYEFDEKKLSDSLTLKALSMQRPLSCHLELSYRCNFRCPMCYVRMTDEQAAAYGRLRTVEEWISMAKELYKAGVFFLTLTGGECTLYPGFEQLYRELYGMGFRISIMSNAAAWTDSVRALFLELPPHFVAVSLYGGSNETYERVTGDAKGLDKVLENISFLQAAGIPVELNFTVIKLNVHDYPEVSRICKERGLSWTRIHDITPHVRDRSFTDYEALRLSPAERVCVGCRKPKEVELALAEAAELEKELENFILPEPHGTKPLMDHCVSSSTSCTIFWNGDMNTCPSLAGDKCYKPFEIGFETAWAELLADRDMRFRMAPACAGCKMRSDCTHNCSARNFQGTGSYHTPDPRVCQYVYLLRKYRAAHPDVTEEVKKQCV